MIIWCDKGLTYRKKIESKDPYQEIIDIIQEWCESEYYTDFLVTIEKNHDTETHYLELDTSSGIEFIWDGDWWEGENDIYLVGFYPIGDIVIYGEPIRERS